MDTDDCIQGTTIPLKYAALIQHEREWIAHALRTAFSRVPRCHITAERYEIVQMIVSLDFSKDLLLKYVQAYERVDVEEEDGDCFHTVRAKRSTKTALKYSHEDLQTGVVNYWTVLHVWHSVHCSIYGDVGDDDDLVEEAGWRIDVLFATTESSLLYAIENAEDKGCKMDVAAFCNLTEDFDESSRSTSMYAEGIPGSKRSPMDGTVDGRKCART
jgi:hypothetical protein